MSRTTSTPIRATTWTKRTWLRLCAALALCASLCLLADCGGGGSGSGGSGGGGGGGGGNTVQIQLVSPSKVMVGNALGGGTVYGTNFTSSSTVLFDGASVQTSYQNSTLQFSVPETVWNVAQSHTVQVSDPSNGKSNVASFLVYSPQPGPTQFNAQLTQYMSETPLANGLVPDLNGDGRADLILATPATSSSSSQIVVRYGQADGTFSASSPLVPFDLSTSPNLVVPGDFNADGHTDLVLIGGAPSSQNSYQVVLNDGTGHFTAGGTGGVPSSAAAAAPVVTGDFNHDGKLDFALGTSNNGQSFSLFLGNGNGTFSAATTIGASTGGVTVEASAADINGDGFTDIVYMELIYNAPNQIRMLLSGPGGNYTDTQIAGLPTGPQGFVLGDFNNDGIPDIFTIDINGMGQAYLGAGNGTFQATGTSIFAFDGYLVTFPFVAGDFDHDGNLDVAIRNGRSSPDQILFLWGDGKGNFTSQSIVSDHSFTLQTGDVNGDGITDLFAEGDPGFAYQSAVLGSSARSFPNPQVLTANTAGPMSIGSVFDAGYTDFLIGGNYTGGSFNVPGSIFQYQSGGTFAMEGDAPTYPTLLVDLNGDGIADMVGFNGEEMLIWKGDGTGVFGAPISTITLPRGFSQYYFRDMDKDGHMDIVLPGVIYYGDGNFNFTPVTWTFSENFVVGDFDGDGFGDIATGSGILFGAGNRMFTAPTGSSPLPDSAPAFFTQVVADINGDGKDDLLLVSANPGIFLSMGRQGFELDQEFIVEGYYPLVISGAVADFNGDGLMDIAIGVNSPEDVLIFTNDGTGKYQLTSYATGIGASQLLGVDLTNAGKPDVVGNAGNIVTVLLHK